MTFCFKSFSVLKLEISAVYQRDKWLTRSVFPTIKVNQRTLFACLIFGRNQADERERESTSFLHGGSLAVELPLRRGSPSSLFAGASQGCENNFIGLCAY